jgi:hypothetical protein
MQALRSSSVSRILSEEVSVHGSRHRRKHPKGRRKVGRKKRRLIKRRRAARTGGK